MAKPITLPVCPVCRCEHVYIEEKHGTVTHIGAYCPNCYMKTGKPKWIKWVNNQIISMLQQKNYIVAKPVPKVKPQAEKKSSYVPPEYNPATMGSEYGVNVPPPPEPPEYRGQYTPPTPPSEPTMAKEGYVAASSFNRDVVNSTPFDTDNADDNFEAPSPDDFSMEQDMAYTAPTVSQGCDICQGLEEMGTTNARYTVAVSEKQIMVIDTTTGNSVVSVPITYCPFCSKKLGE